jgi:hypothetical protein
MGLAPNAPSDHDYKTFVRVLFDAGIIKKNMFSIYLAKTDDQSKIWFGGYDIDRVRNSLLEIKKPEEVDAMSDADVEK